MNIEIGIIGLSQSGRTAVFKALTGSETGGDGHGREGAAHLGVARVADPRLDTLTAMLHPKKTVAVSIAYIDVGASVKGLVEGQSIGGRLLAQLSRVDALIVVIRDFADDSVPHPDGSVDVARDIAAMDLELAFSDLAIIERRQERVETSLKAATPAERQAFLREQEALAGLRRGLEKDVPAREQGLTAEEVRLVSNFQLLTAKPLLVAVNIGEAGLPEAASLERQLNDSHSRPGRRVVVLCGKLEMELAQLDEETATSWRQEFGLTESGAERIVGASYNLMGLVTFFSTASDEVRAWPIPRGTAAPAAAGRIHSDMERGFIRAEVVGYDDLVACGSLAEARHRGLLRTEGRNYLVADGDVITFLFNV
ncbi:MAG: DUF933 domain-containing protein [Dehalococcoidales bacterium]